ncbi:M23 family metallopeptidase [Microbacterium sp. C7(2022)]|uniref:M23 family metallopeptidase n=1 Tax=Microbacterium sp. C7(2022) TaxID=2992759 RepID=UPI00237B6C9D|nr:M23 family metallopeptidase [Microbacterium sp. C7(2022)]MDE0546121.1 M23 family metallopeptidase [Microbacterium sp. C7(2022)]
MTSDAAQAENAPPTRRSSRTSPTPVQASGGSVISSRAELRKRAAGAMEVSPAVAESVKTKDAGAPAVAAVPAVSVAPSASVAPEAAPLSRRARRLATGAQPVQPVESAAVEPISVEQVEAERAAAEAVVEPVPVETELPASVTPESVAPTDERVADAASDTDAFEAAARLFSFTGEVKVATEVDPEAADEGEDEGEQATQSTDTGLTRVRAVPGESAPARRGVSRGAAFKRVATMSFSVGVMGAVGLLTVGLTTPAEAMAAMGSGSSVTVMAPGDTTGTQIDEDQIQAYVAPATIENATLERSGGYDTVTTAELASESGISNVSNLYVNDPNAAIQWPFAVGVPYSYGFGMRSGRMHEGIDFTPGAGSPVQAIADGTVRVATEAGGAYGVHVIIDHIIDGQLVSSHYAHMQYGSLQVSTGQKVTVGTVLGRTGNTGRSFGAHTHFEILMNGTTPVDPLPWLQNNAGRSSLG